MPITAMPLKHHMNPHQGTFSRALTPFGCAPLTAAVLALAGAAQAAPLDALLESSPQARYGSGMLEIGADAMNKSLDVLKIRNNDPSLPDNAGDYTGQHLRAGLAVGEGGWIDASLTRRHISYSSDRPQIDSWQLAGQWQLLQATSLLPDTSVRLSTWGNHAGSVTRTGSVGSLPVQQLSISNVKDRQWQLDLIGTWRWPSTAVSVLAGAGTGQVSVGTVSAKVGGQNYTYNASMAGLLQVIDPSYKNQLDALNYNTRFVHAGFNIRHHIGAWSLHGGYDLTLMHRNPVDDVIASLPTYNKTYTVNHTLVGEVSYRLAQGVRVFTRGQLMTNNFLSEIPMIYNSVTAKRFNEKYGLVSLGVAFDF